MTDSLEGADFSPVLRGGGVAPPRWRTAAYSQYPRCMNSTAAAQPPFTPNRDPCCGHAANQFTHMGLSVRTHSWRYTLAHALRNALVDAVSMDVVIPTPATHAIWTGLKAGECIRL